MSASIEFSIGIPKGARPSCNGQIKTMLLLRVGDVQHVESVRLDSTASVKKTSQEWSQRFQIDADAVAERLRQICVSLMADRADAQARTDAKVQRAERISELADAFIGSLKPAWHRAGKTLFLEAGGREVAVTEVWRHASDDWIDRVGDTKEGLEDEGMNYRSRLVLLRDAVTMAATRILATLPEFETVKRDQTLNRAELLADLEAWLLRERVFRTDTGTPISTSYYAWACGLAPGEAWQQCFNAAVYGRMKDAGTPPEIALKGSVLKADLKRTSSVKLGSDLEAAGYAKADSQFVKVTGRSVRVWKLQPIVMNSIATIEGGSHA